MPGGMGQRWQGRSGKGARAFAGNRPVRVDLGDAHDTRQAPDPMSSSLLLAPAGWCNVYNRDG